MINDEKQKALDCKGDKFPFSFSSTKPEPIVLSCIVKGGEVM